jgi:gamma-F420-2:alpha-L-glutamate ligase
MERRAVDGGFKSNISTGGRGTPFALPPAMAELAVRVASVLDLDVAGVDVLFDGDGYRICEANSSPGFQGLESACRISVPDEIFSAMASKFRLPYGAPPSRWRRAVRTVRQTLGGRRAA